MLARKTEFKCVDCKEVKPVQKEGGTGYACIGKNRDRKICYSCCAIRDRKDMVKRGRATLYLTCEPAHKMLNNGSPYNPSTLNQGTGRATRGTVSNWPNTLSFPCHTRVGHHNIARYRYDVWFRGPDGFVWHGVTIGDNTQICHCKRTKERKE